MDNSPESEMAEKPHECTMARFAIQSAQSGVELIERTKPHEEQAFFLAMGLITNTRAIFFALVNRDAKRSPEHASVIAAWRKKEVPELKRFKRILVSVRDQFTKEFSTTPLVVVVTGNVGAPRHELPIYIPFDPEFDEVLTGKERNWRAILAKGDTEPQMRVDLVRECETALVVWRSEIEKIEAAIRDKQLR